MENIRYMFVIDTDSYSGNFERAMCAYVTGMYGNCHVGKEIAKLVKHELTDYDFRVQERVDSEGRFSIVSMYPTPGWSNNGNGGQIPQEPGRIKHYKYPAYNSVAIHFSEKPHKALIKVMKNRALEFVKTDRADLLKVMRPEHLTINIEGFRLVKEETISTIKKI